VPLPARLLRSVSSCYSRTSAWALQRHRSSETTPVTAIVSARGTTSSMTLPVASLTFPFMQSVQFQELRFRGWLTSLCQWATVQTRTAIDLLRRCAGNAAHYQPTYTHRPTCAACAAAPEAVRGWERRRRPPRRRRCATALAASGTAHGATAPPVAVSGRE